VAMISAAAPWAEIRRTALEHDCDSVLLGLGGTSSGASGIEGEIEALINDLDCDVAMVRSDPTWRLAEARRVLVPVGGRGDEHGLRARMIASISREAEREITFVTVRPAGDSDDKV